MSDELVDDPIQVTSITPGLVATNIGRDVDPELLAGIAAMSGTEVEIVIRPNKNFDPWATYCGLGAALVRLFEQTEVAADRPVVSARGHFVASLPQTSRTFSYTPWS